MVDGFFSQSGYYTPSSAIGLPALAAELVRRKVEVIVALGG
jgi:hypothetical protein